MSEHKRLSDCREDRCLTIFRLSRQDTGGHILILKVQSKGPKYFSEGRERRGGGERKSEGEEEK